MGKRKANPTEGAKAPQKFKKPLTPVFIAEMVRRDPELDAYTVGVEIAYPKPNYHVVKIKSNWYVDYQFAHNAIVVDVELEGGIFVNGGHNRGMGYHKNCEKYNYLTASLGHKVLRFTILHFRNTPNLMFYQIRQALGLPLLEDNQP